jgi:hypothetical protein
LASPGAGWEAVAQRTKIVALSPLALALVPSLLVPGASKATRGVTFPAGKSGALLGSLAVAASLLLGWLLSGPMGPVAYAALFWLAGTTGVAMIAGAVRPVAFVKPICTRCRLLPIIVEHEAIHLAGVAREGPVWASMRQRHSAESLHLKGDPSICPFCPIPKRLEEG